jgi:large subunit ribosomal protein L15
MLYFEGGQMPLQRRVPKRGFCNPTRVRVVTVDVGALERFDAGTDVTLELLRERGLIKGRHDRVKVLGTGQLSKKLAVHAHAFSQGAAAKIEAAGGSTVVETSSPTGASAEPAAAEATAD